MNYKEILEKYPWIKEEKQKLIISPDSDGLIKCIVIFKLFSKFSFI